MLIPVILSGGVGSRLWPLSREFYPKQLLALLGEQTMLQNTMLRLQGLADMSPPLIVCNEVHRFLVAEQLRVMGCNPMHIILEPIGRNTAPAVAIAALAAQARDAEALLLVLPADHLIEAAETFCQVVTAGIQAAQNHQLVTFGVVPNHPETGYGYIKAASVTTGIAPVSQFVEKPDLATAERYVQSGDYYWNSGMFLFRAATYLAELQKFAPDMFNACQHAYQHAEHDRDFLRLDKAAFSACPSDSIDYAVMEKTDAASVLPLDAGWSDVGSWSSLWAVSEKDAQENVCLGDVLTSDTTGCYLRAEHRLLATVGLHNHIVVETADAVMVAHRDRVQDIKKIVAQLKADKRQEADLHRKVYRPWGSYENIEVGERFQVKLIVVNPNASLSLQLHYHRSEHWIVVNGTALVTCDDEQFILSENQSTYIPLGKKHRLENPGRLPLEIIEIQSGSYLGEDDIVRYEDVYGRHQAGD